MVSLVAFSCNPCFGVTDGRYDFGRTQNSVYQPTNLMHMAMALIEDLRLKQPPGSCELKNFIIAPSKENAFPDPSNVRSRSAEERRVLAGCFYLTSMASTCVKRFEAMRLTWYTERCFRDLLEVPECNGDRQLAQLVRLQMIVERLGSSRLFQGSNVTYEPSETPTWIYFKAFQSELRDYKTGLPNELRSDS